MKFALLSVAIVLAVVFIIVRVVKGGIWGLFTKTTASLAFVVLALFGAYVSGLNLIAIFIIIGLMFGLIGDIILDLKIIYKQESDAYLNAGMLSFALGHFMYLVATVLFANKILINDIKTLYLAVIAFGIAGIITIAISLLEKPVLKLDFGKFRLQSLGYTFILSFMSAFSIAVAIFNNMFFIFAVGVLLIFISDLILSLQYFGAKQENKILTILNHSIYYLGQIAIAFSLFFIIWGINMKNITLHTDGACSGNPGIGGWGCILDYKGTLKELAGFNESTTNNQMELTAVIEGLKALKQPCKVDVYSDSAYVVNAFLFGWIDSWVQNNWKTADKKSVKNVDLWQQLLSLCKIHQVTWHKVKGHADNERNNRCDYLATNQIALHKQNN